jgi:hypothetical protein
MNCEQMQELFSAYLDKMTNIKESQSIEAHLQQCPQCQRQLGEMSRMCAFLKKLDNPQIPASFTADIHKQLSHEKIRHFPGKEIITPKRTGWMAAVVAGIALTVGIFAGSYLPYGTMMASLQDWLNKDNRPSAAVVDNNKTIQNWMKKQLAMQNAATGNEAVDPAAPTGSNPLQTIKPDNTTGIAPTVSKLVTVAVQERVAQDYTAKLQVNDMDKSMQDLMQVAYASGAQISVQSTTVMAATASNVKVVALQVPKDKVDSLLSDLAGLGGGTPVQDNTSYTQAYTENQKVLSTLEQDIRNLQASSSLSAQEQAQLQTLQQQKLDLQTEQVRIDKAINSVTVEVRMVQATNP